MGNKWRKLKLALGLDSCVHTPRAFDDSSAATASVSSGVSPTIISSACNTSGYRPSIPTPLSYGYPNPLRHRWMSRYRAPLWDNSSRREGQNRKGKQGGYDKEEKAARVYDLVALKVLHYIIPID
ncbi:hypothetical protein JHK82_018233 [Glycine max]|nr:hypothetical protein JHK87_018127 [Glycine soja]KAG5022317.1 hypothetical protein JHK85_018659 [Glycine max]KAG5142538.1 hypothetical protein JHK82_018233 [Glycine max]